MHTHKTFPLLSAQAALTVEKTLERTRTALLLPLWRIKSCHIPPVRRRGMVNNRNEGWFRWMILAVGGG